MSDQLNHDADDAGPEVVRQVAVWLDQCGQSAIGQSALGQGPAALLFAGMRTALLDRDGYGHDIHPVLVAATVSAREADPGAAAEMRALLAENYRPGWAPLLAALAYELDLADAQGQRRVRDAGDDAQGLDGVPPEWTD